MMIGYACIALGLDDSRMRGCILKNASTENLDRLITTNLQTLSRILDYNIRHHIALFRISSDIIPFGSHPVNQNRWWESHSEPLEKLGDKIKSSGMRVSMHPGQYTILNALDPQVVERAIKDLEYHARFLDALGIDGRHKIILHVGGHYGDSRQALSRFSNVYTSLSPQVKRRLVIENDEKYDISQVLDLAIALQMPAVFDVFHHQCNQAPQGKTEGQWLELCNTTWGVQDGVQKIHYSQQEPGLRPGAHSGTIKLQPFLQFYRQLPQRDLALMLEVKDKDLSAIKCQLAVDPAPPRRSVEEEWARYKYLVMEHSYRHYQAIGKALNPNLPVDSPGFYLLVEEALTRKPEPGQAWNAAQHVWGYFKDVASATERVKWQNHAEAYQRGEEDQKELKSFLKRLAKKYHRQYLLDSYYFRLR